MSKDLLRTVRLEFQNPAENKNKFYEVEVFLEKNDGMYHVSRRFGRIGSNTLPTFVFESASLNEAHNHADNLVNKKISSKKDPYKVISDINKTEPPKKVKSVASVVIEEEPAVEFDHSCWGGMNLNRA